MKHRAWTAARWMAVVLLCAQILGAQEGISAPSQQLGLTIPMRDGIRLAADLFLPPGAEHWPAILVRTPYNRKTSYSQSYQFFATHGYAVVIQDVRGRYASQGRFGSTTQEGPDGSDTLDWIARQPWSNGRVGMIGSSYLGLAVWWAAVQNNPHLAAISPMYSGDDEYRDRYYSTGGALQVGHRLLWLADNLTPPSHVKPLFESYIDHLPLETADILATGTALSLWRTAISHPSYDDYWRALSIREKLGRLSIPVLSWGGWFDAYAESDLHAFGRLAKEGKAIETWIGPWAHDPSWRFPTHDFGRAAEFPIRLHQLQWFDRWLKPATEPEGHDPVRVPASLHIFVMGPNIWREEHEWPLMRARPTPLYLANVGPANTVLGGGRLLPNQPEGNTPDQFTYNPNEPTPTLGGAICCDRIILPPGPLDQTPVEKRNDVLVYTSAPLEEPLEVTGTVQALLYVATSANDTDFAAKLVDVQPDGLPLLVTDGMQRLRYRLSLSKPVLVRRNAPYQIVVDAGVTSYVFPRGHSVRLEISSSNFPRYDRNLNSSRPVASESRAIIARQTVYHNTQYPSALILPVIPRVKHKSEGHHRVHETL